MGQVILSRYYPVSAVSTGVNTFGALTPNALPVLTQCPQFTGIGRTASAALDDLE